jgi:hypothetical protein
MSLYAALLALLASEEQRAEPAPVYRPVQYFGGGEPPAPEPPAGPVLPQVASASLLLDLEADMFSLADNDPVSTWADQSGNGNDFTQTGDERPTFVANKNGHPALYFGGYNHIQYMNGPSDVNFADNLPAMAVFAISLFDASVNDDGGVIVKYDIGSNEGWGLNIDAASITAFFAAPGGSDFMQTSIIGLGLSDFHVYIAERLSPSVANVYLDGDSTGENITGSNTAYPTSQLILLGAYAYDLPFDAFSGWMRAVLIYQITDLDNWPTDRAAITAYLAARYGVTLP